MRIGIVTTWQERGAAYVSRQYYNVLSKKHDVLIYARGGEKYAINNKIWDKDCVTWGKKIPIHMPLSIDLLDFKKWIVNNKIELVFFNEQQWWPPVLLCHELGIKIGSYIDYYTPETVHLFGIFDFLICNTQRHLEVFKWHPQVFFVAWGTDINLFNSSNFLPVNKNHVTFFHSCGMSPLRKGTDILIRAFDKLEHPKKLIIHSQVNLRLLLVNLENIINKMINNRTLEIINKEVPAPGLYHLGDVYVYPTRLEGIGLTICEALSRGLPVITSNNPPMSEFINNTNGRLVKIAKFEKRNDNYYWKECIVDENSLVKAMKYYINNFKVISKLKFNSRHSAVVRFDWYKNSSDLAQIFSSIIKLNNKEEIINKIIDFEKKRSNLITKIYLRAPWLFKPFDWFWPVMKLYILNK